MKCVITYLQNKRVALPYIFGKYCYPQMCILFPGEMQLYHIVHDAHYDHSQLESNRLSIAHLTNVREFIKNNKYPEAKIIHHETYCVDLLSLPSIRLGVETFLSEDADLHLWVEDDAIIFDLDCNCWFDKMKDVDVGLYRYTMHAKMINCAFMLSTKEYDKKLLPALYDYRKDNKYYPGSSQIEHLLWTHVTKNIVLNPDDAIRHHPYDTWKTNKDDVKSWLRRKIPNITDEDINLLDLDFGD